jgi:integrase
MAKYWITDLWIKKSSKPPERVYALCDRGKLDMVEKKYRTNAFGKNPRFKVGFMESADIGLKCKAVYKYFKTKKECELYVLELGYQLISKTYTPFEKKNKIVREVAEEWAETKKSVVGDGQYYKIRSALRLYILPKFGQRKIADISEIEIYRWINMLNEKGLSASYIRNIVKNVFGAILNYATNRKRNYIPFSPMEDIKMSRKNAKTRQISFLDEDQVFALAKAAYEVDIENGVTNATFILFMAYLGTRVNETAAIQIKDISFDTNRIQITKTFKNKNGTGKLILGETKNKKPRKVPIPKFLKPAIVQLCRGKTPDRFLFELGGQRGYHPINLNNWRMRVWYKAKARAGLSGMKDLTIHSLRHTCATLAIKAGGDVKTVQALLGHQDASITLNTYAGLFPDSLDNIADKMAVDTIKVESLMSSEHTEIEAP